MSSILSIPWLAQVMYFVRGDEPALVLAIAIGSSGFTKSLLRLVVGIYVDRVEDEAPSSKHNDNCKARKTNYNCSAPKQVHHPSLIHDVPCKYTSILVYMYITPTIIIIMLDFWTMYSHPSCILGTQ